MPTPWPIKIAFVGTMISTAIGATVWIKKLREDQQKALSESQGKEIK